MLIDTHCHLNIMIKDTFDVPLDTEFEKDARAILEAAAKNNVTQIVNVGTSLIESKNCVILARAFKECFATVGIHPNDITASWKDDIQVFVDLIKEKSNKIVAVGEIGLDYHYPNFDKELQYQVLRAQIELALEHSLPIIIHTRDATDEVLHVLKEYKQHPLKGIIHCFSEDQKFADFAIELGFFLGIGGPLTYPQNDSLRSIFKTIPLESIVLETDAPFLPPQSIRGKKNSPAQIKTIAEALAELRGISVEEVATQTTRTATALLSL